MSARLWNLFLVCFITIGSQTKTSPATAVPLQRDSSSKLDITARSGALETLADLLDDLNRLIESEDTRASLRGQIADVLWDHDPAKAKQELSNAVSAMIAFIGSTSRRSDRLVARTAPRSDVAALKLLKITSKRDSLLTKRLSAALVPNASTNESERSRLAFQTLDVDPKLSMELAGETLVEGQVSGAFVSYLAQLRQKSPLLADELFNKALTSSLNSALWAKPIANLAMYALPGFGDARMRASFGLDDQSNIDKSSSDALLRGVCRVTTNQLQTQEKTPALAAALTAVVLSRLQPYFQGHLPSCADNIRVAADSMMKLVSDDQMRQQIVRSSKTSSREELLSEASAATSKSTQDHLYVEALLQEIAREEWSSALSIAEMLSREEYRTSWRKTISLKAAQAMIQRKNVDQALEYSKVLESPDDIAIVFSGLFSLIMESRDSQYALEVLLRGKERILNGGEMRRPTALLTLALSALKTDPSLAFEIARKAIECLNGLHDTKSKENPQYLPTISAKLEATMVAFARVDFSETIILSRMVADKTLSTMSTVEVCRAALIPATNSLK